MSEFPHLDESGAAHMVDVGDKPHTRRAATAQSFVSLAPATVELVRRDGLHKGDALAVARLAGIAAAKRASDLILLAHPLAITHVAVHLELEEDGVRITARVETTGPTGVEMEALTSAMVASLNLYDMVKGVDRGATILDTKLLEKHGGRSQDWKRNE